MSIYVPRSAHRAGIIQLLELRGNRLVLGLGTRFGHGANGGAPAQENNGQFSLPRVPGVNVRREIVRHGNLPLAAQRCVGHIGLTGDVAEWLKAAVC
jgi:hypothetical protein